MNTIKKQILKFIELLPKPQKRAKCQICLNLVKEEELVPMNGHDYQYYSASLVCSKCLNQHKEV